MLSSYLSTTFLSYVAAFFSTSCFIPQAIKVLRSDNTRSVSFVGYLLLFIGVVLWCVYGILTSQLAISIANGIVVALVTIILFKKLYNVIKKID